MTDDNLRDGLDDAFETLEPPRGGLTMLRERLERDQRRLRWWMLAAPVVAAAVVFLAVWLGRPAPSVYVIQRAPMAAAKPVASAAPVSVEQPGLVSLGLRDAPGSGAFTPEALVGTQLLREVSRSDEVLLYHVATLGSGTAGAESRGTPTGE